MDLLKSNFKPKATVDSEETPQDVSKEYEKKALENIGGSMVFVERKKLTWDKRK